MFTFAGFMAVLFWSISIPVSRSLTEKIGIFNTPGLVFIIGGSLQMLRYALTDRAEFRSLASLSPRHMLSCGSGFLLYAVTLNSAVGFASGRNQIVEIGLINYLWPAMILLLSIPILNNKASPWLIAGIFVSISGVMLATASSSGGSSGIEGFLQNISTNTFPYASAFAAALLWGIYSNLSKLYGALSSKLSVPLFLLVSGVVLEILSFSRGEKSVWSATAFAELALLAIFPCLLAYTFWDLAMRKGNMILVASFSYLSPLLSILTTGLYLGVRLTAGVWIACGLVIAGAVICNFSIRERKAGEVSTKEKAECEPPSGKEPRIS